MKWISFMCLTAILSGCSLEPRYQRPCIEPAACWRGDYQEGSTDCNLRWWESLADPILDALVQAALANNNDLQVAAWRVCEYAGHYQVVMSALYPQIGLNASAVKQRYPINGSFLPAGFDPITPLYAYRLTFSYELDFWGKLRSAAHAAYEELLAQVENRRTVVLTLVSEVAQSYILLRQLDQELKISYETLESRKESLQLAIYRYEGGLTSEIEVAQAASLYDETLAGIKKLERQIPQVENLISVLIGENPTCILRGRPVDQFLLPPLVPAGLPSDLLERRPDILKAENELIAANAQIGVARAAFFPQISLTGFYGGQSFQLKHLFSGSATTWQYGGGLFQPLFTGGQLTGQLKVAEAQKQEAIFHYRQVILNAFREVNDALIAHQKAKERVEVQQANVAALKEYLKLAWLRYYEGQDDYLTVLDAERKLFEGQIDLTQAQGETFSTLVDIYKALAGGWVIDADCCLRP